MRGTQFGEFNAFMAVAEQRNFTRAAKSLGISPGTLSQTIRTLEERLGLRLLNRTTRSVAPTEAGDMLLLRLRPVIDDYEAAIESLNKFRGKPAGQLRLSVAPPAVPDVIVPKLARFVAQYPDIRLEISVDSANVDIVSQQYDAGIRAEHRIDRDMIAIPVSHDIQGVIAGSPDYFARHPRPKVPQDLVAHNCVRNRLANGALLPWHFEKAGDSFDIAVTGNLILNDVELVKQAALDGIALVQFPRVYLAKEIADKRLTTVLEDWRPKGPKLSLYYPSRRQMPTALRALIDFFRKD